MNFILQEVQQSMHHERYRHSMMGVGGGGVSLVQVGLILGCKGGGPRAGFRDEPAISTKA